MARIFLAYRRKDSAFYVNAIRQELERRFGQRSIVQDVTANIRLGDDFRKFLQDAVRGSNALLAVIGTQWLDSIRSRSEDEGDLLRLEIETALASGIPVVPVLVGGAKMPRKADLPPAISELVYRQAAEVRSGARLNPDLSALGKRLQAAIADPGRPGKRRSRGEDLVLRISVKPKSGDIGIRFVWTVTVRNDGNAPLAEVEVRRGNSPLHERPLELAPGKSRRFTFDARYPKPGKKTNSVSAVAAAADGTPLKIATRTSVEVH